MSKYRTKPVEVEALQVVIGTVSRSQILAIAPTANVGTIFDDFDVRWVNVEVSRGWIEVHDFGWIVALPGGALEVHTNNTFRKLFEEVAE